MQSYHDGLYNVLYIIATTCIVLYWYQYISALWDCQRYCVDDRSNIILSWGKLQWLYRIIFVDNPRWTQALPWYCWQKPHKCRRRSLIVLWENKQDDATTWSALTGGHRGTETPEVCRLLPVRRLIDIILEIFHRYLSDHCWTVAKIYRGAGLSGDWYVPWWVNIPLSGIEIEQIINREELLPLHIDQLRDRIFQVKLPSEGLTFYL